MCVVLNGVEGFRRSLRRCSDLVVVVIVEDVAELDAVPWLIGVDIV